MWTNFLEPIYLMAFGGGLFSLLLWILFAQWSATEKIFRTLVLILLPIWIASIFLAPMEMKQKLVILSRDALLIGITALLVSQSKSNKFVGMGVVLAAAVAFKLFGLPLLKGSFEERDLSQLAKEGELFVHLKPSSDVISFKESLLSFHVDFLTGFKPEDEASTFLDEILIIDIPNDEVRRIARLENFLNQSPEVEYWEENEEITLPEIETLSSEEIFRKNISFLNDPMVSQQWGLDLLNVKEVHKWLTGNEEQIRKKARVFILDTGIDGSHEDLSTHYQSVNKKYDIDKTGHGTHVAGIVAAISNNKIGIASLLPLKDILQISSVKVLNDFGMGTQKTILNGMIEAADQGADVISLSLGGRSNNEKERLYSEAVKYCNQKGAIVVVAAGNSSSNAKYYTPANAKGVITVSAIDEKLNITPFSNRIDELEYGLAAPGNDILSTYPNNTYRSMKGTSMATPFVSSIIGIMKAFRPELTTKQAFEILSDSGVSSQQAKETGPVIQPNKALQLLTMQNEL